MTKIPGVGGKLIFPKPTTKFERDLVAKLIELFKEVDDYAKSNEARIEALEP